MATDDTTGKSSDVLTSAASKLFDIRIMIGGLFTLYGIMLIIYGFFTSKHDVQQASGIHINTWLGAAMLILGIVFLVWARLAPPKHPDPDKVDHTRPAHH
jgi:prolipoprotein diacylglyceryltransferase